MFKKTLAKIVIISILSVSLFSSTGCTDRARDAIMPSLFEGLSWIATGLVDGLEAYAFPDGVSGI